MARSLISCLAPSSSVVVAMLELLLRRLHFVLLWPALERIQELVNRRGEEPDKCLHRRLVRRRRVRPVRPSW